MEYLVIVLILVLPVLWELFFQLYLVKRCGVKIVNDVKSLRYEEEVAAYTRQELMALGRSVDELPVDPLLIRRYSIVWLLLKVPCLMPILVASYALRADRDFGIRLFRWNLFFNLCASTLARYWTCHLPIEAHNSLVYAVDLLEGVILWQFLSHPEIWRALMLGIIFAGVKLATVLIQAIAFRFVDAGGSEDLSRLRFIGLHLLKACIPEHYYRCYLALVSTAVWETQPSWYRIVRATATQPDPDKASTLLRAWERNMLPIFEVGLWFWSCGLWSVVNGHR